MSDYNHEITSKRLGAVILAGGRGSRMGGHDKGLIKIQNRTLIETVLDQIHPYINQTVISANRNIKQYQDLGYQVIQDDTPDFSGPLAGIARAMDVMNKELLLVIAVDMPALPSDVIPKLLSLLDLKEADICCIKEGERLQPLVSVINTRLKADLTQYLQNGHRKVTDWFQQHKLATLELEDNTIVNLNTFHELEKYSK